MQNPSARGAALPSLALLRFAMFIFNSSVFTAVAQTQLRQNGVHEQIQATDVFLLFLFKYFILIYLFP
jgi:hypothetical protein